MDRDRLLQPTLADYRDPVGSALPWSFNRLFYPAFFGGPLAFAMLGAVNARRLGLPRRASAQVIGWGVLFEALVLAALATHTFVILAVTGAGIAAQWCSRDTLETPDRVYHYFTRRAEPYARLADVAVLACLGARMFEIVILAAVIG